MVQRVIDRMSSNSFHLKGWSVVIVSALFALAAERANMVLVYLAYFPAVAFYVLDGYFLHQERLYRALHDHVRVLGDVDIDFSMDTRPLESESTSWSAAMLSKPTSIFHGTVIGLIIIVLLLTSAVS